MQERSVDGALIALRRLTIRESREGLEHVEALLALRGVDLPEVRAAKRRDVAGYGLMRYWITKALSYSPILGQLSA